MLAIVFCNSVSIAQKNQVEDQKSSRIEKIINSQWTFNYFPYESADKGYESSRFDDSKWPAVSLPHTWNTYETTGELHPYIRNASESDNPYWWMGWGWYRKHFTINGNYSDKKIFIEFEGVHKYCKVWLNGKYLGDHKGGYGSFDFDVTDLIKPGEDNILAVAVNNLQEDKSKIPPMAAGNFNVYGGIYRDVTLVLKSNLYIPMQGSASHEGGTFVTTPKVSDNEGVVRVLTWVKNDNQEKKNCTLVTSVADATGKIVQVIKSEAEINPGQLYKFDQTGKAIKNPHLWSNEDPYLYMVYSEVMDGKKVADDYSSPFGFRWFRWDYKENYLYVNGSKILIHGGDRNQEYPWLGNAIPKWITVMDYLDMSEKLNYNFIRTAHYPNDKLVYELADKYGIIIDEETPGIKNQFFSVEVQEQQLKEMIRRDRNHPSIMFWSMGNETNHAVDSKFAIATKNGQTVTAQVVMAGEPAKIILTGSHQKILADRGSVAIITADIVDSGGNHVYGATHSVRWTVTGPATLVGPAIYESDINKHHQMEGVRYMDMPVSNVIRSTGNPGNIHITVSAGGLASGSFDILAEEIVQDNSLITEPVLDDEGRKPVSRITLSVNRLEEPPREIKMATDEFNFKTSDKPEFARLIRDYILKNNSSIDSASIEFRALVKLYSSYLFNNNGRMVANDYNFNADHYNNCRLITSYISSTKLPLLFKEGLSNFYAEAIILQGSERNAGEEMNWLNWIPSGGTVVIFTEDTITAGNRGAFVINKNKLSDLIALVHPGFVNFSEVAKERALIFISKMNPYISVSFLSEKSHGGNKNDVITTSYLAEKGQPILIPDLKFIAE